MSFLNRFFEGLKRSVIFCYGAMAGRKSYIPDIDSLPTVIPESFRFYADTPNTIIRFRDGAHEGFFRECRRHLRPKAFLHSLFADYCQYVYVTEHSEECRQILYGFVENSKYWKRLYHMGDGTARYSRITRFRQTGDASILGFTKPLPDWFYNQLLQLVQFAWGPLMEYRYCCFLQYGDYQSFNSSKSMVTKIMDTQIDQEPLIPNTYYARLVLDGVTRVGVVVDLATGEDPVHWNEKPSYREINPILQKNLSSLWLLDLLCYQKDHRPGNFFVGKTTDGRFGTVSAFDNDCPMTLFPVPSISLVSYTGIYSLVGKKGLIRVPFLDRSIVDQILTLDTEALSMTLRSYCSRMESSMLIGRVSRLKKAIKHSLITGCTVLLSEEEWSNETMQKEMALSLDTYFSFFVKNYCE